MKEKYNLYVVYFVNCLTNKNYMFWVKNQLGYIVQQLENNTVKLLNKTEIHIIATINKENEARFLQKVHRHFPNFTFNIQFYDENEYEYQGINKVWELGQVHDNKNDIILYYHSKGITHHVNYKHNRNDNYNIILKDLNQIFKIYSEYSEIDKIGYSCGGIGWIWYNFWYARGSYISHVEKPIKTERRHYYEDWLGRYVKDKKDQYPLEERPYSYYENSILRCYNFHTNIDVPSIGFYYDPSPNVNKYLKYNS